MAFKVLTIKNSKPTLVGSFGYAAAIGPVTMSVRDTGEEWRVELKTNGQSFLGTGRSVALALRSLDATKRHAAIKHESRGRTPERVRVAATLLEGSR
jgi:hypothetical protein